ncbi:transcriptional regulator [Wenjunlia vitaminophila]|uniref:Transcriptional regulator n=1 Tax=Wenjunlia vitaminophila TaxID=76728 RepID=A0A0T6LRS6_WENVI|nr:LCP family protein [Wenjunlia vitaminophila]KRV48742.1 transcriptional regulator [Wenjunlia vitaminophila]
MNEWPDGFSNDDRRRGESEPTRVMGHVQRQGGYPPQPPQQPPAEPPLPPSLSPRRAAAAGGVPHQSSGPGGRPPGPGGAPGGPVTNRPAGDGRRRWPRRVLWTSLGLVGALIITTIATYFWADSKLHRDVDLSKVIERPKGGDGTNYLIVGSDSREGMSAEDKKRLHTGSADGKRTDSVMILHVGDNGNTMISLPRDSEVEIPSFRGSESGKLYPGQGRKVKLNAAYAEDGPELLVRTIEAETGLRIDHYAEIGFDGFADVVDAVGGVEMDIPRDIKDSKSGADFKKGKQTLNGEEALAFVRTRYALPGSDLDRTKNQQKFLAALADQAAKPTTILNPFSFYPVAGAGLDSLIVDKDMGLTDLAEMFWAMKGVTGGDGKSMNIPLAGSNGSNLLWDEAKVKKLVEQLNNDEKVTVSGN